MVWRPVIRPNLTIEWIEFGDWVPSPRTVLQSNSPPPREEVEATMANMDPVKAAKRREKGLCLLHNCPNIAYEGGGGWCEVHHPLYLKHKPTKSPHLFNSFAERLDHARQFIFKVDFGARDKFSNKEIGECHISTYASRGYYKSKTRERENGHVVISYKGSNHDLTRGILEAKLRRSLVPGRGADAEYACHHCDEPRCINPRHLYPGSRKLNMDHYYKENPGAIPDAEVIKIRKSTIHPKVLAKRYGVSKGHICSIRAGKSRRQVRVG